MLPNPSRPTSIVSYTSFLSIGAGWRSTDIWRQLKIVHDTSIHIALSTLYVFSHGHALGFAWTVQSTCAFAVFVPQALGAAAEKFSITRDPRGEPKAAVAESIKIHGRTTCILLYTAYCTAIMITMEMLPYLGYSYRSVSHCMWFWHFWITLFAYEGKLKINAATWSW